jgi:hypothetical protein
MRNSASAPTQLVSLPGTGSTDTPPYIEMTIAKFNRLKLKTDVDETRAVFGRHGQIFEHAPGCLGLMFSSRTAKSGEMWGNRRRAGVAAGMEVAMDGDREGVLSFDPRNPKQVAVAIAIAGAKLKRTMSAKQKEAFARARSKSPIGKRVVGPTGRTVSTHAGEPL